MGGDKKPQRPVFPRGGHGKTVVAESASAKRRCGGCSGRASPTSRRSRGRDARRDRVRHAVGGLHAGLGDRRDLRRYGSGPGHGRDELDGARSGPAGRRGLHVSIRLPGPRGGHRRRGHGACPTPVPGSSCWAAPAQARSTASPRSSPRRRWRSRSRPPRRWRPQARPSFSGRTTSAANWYDRVIEGSSGTADNEAKATYLRPDEVIEMLRIWLMAMLAAAVLGTVRDHDLLHRTGLIGYARPRPLPTAKRHLARVREGRDRRRPNLTGNSCSRRGQSGKVEYWSCRTPVNTKALTTNRARQSRQTAS